MARIVILNVSNWGESKECDGLRLRIENDRLRSEVGLLQREIEIKDARFARLDSKKRPHYRSCERLEILMIRAARGLTNGQTAKRFQATVQTIINWFRGIDKDELTVQMPEKQSPTTNQIASSMQQIYDNNGVKPKYLISDKGTQFTSSESRSWCNENEIRQRFGAVGKHGSIAVTERVILTYKDGCTRRILVPLSKNEMTNETRLFFDWYNEYRPHMTLSSKTPNEVYFRQCSKFIVFWFRILLSNLSKERFRTVKTSYLGIYRPLQRAARF